MSWASIRAGGGQVDGGPATGIGDLSTPCIGRLVEELVRKGRNVAIQSCC